MIKEIMIQFLPEKSFCACGTEAVYSVWSWAGAEKDYVPNRAVCQKCGDDLSRKIQEGELIEVIQRHTK
jgi:hypothetical protein